VKKRYLKLLAAAVVTVLLSGCSFGDDTQILRDKLDDRVNGGTDSLSSDTSTGDVADSDTAVDSESETGSGFDSDTFSDTESGSDTEGICFDNGDCDDSWCDTEHGECKPCTEDFACGAGCVVCGEGVYSGLPRCSSGSCVECLVSGDCSSEQPVCDTSGNSCHECLSDSDCRTEGSVFSSPVGVCTPDKTCTCWTPADAPDGACTSSSCPDGYTCAEDKPGTAHYVCLKECSELSEPVTGIGCINRDTLPSHDSAPVWVPMTTCYAFSRFGSDCESGGLADDNKCRINSTLDDGRCEENGTLFTCTYSCWDGASGSDNWCPSGFTCDKTSNLCK
jgi:hypothetical protein